MLGLYSGEPAAKTLRPKNASRTLDLALLDAQGVPLSAPQSSVFLHWADNNALAPPRSLQMMAVSRREGSLSAQRRSSVGRTDIGQDYSTHSNTSGMNTFSPVTTSVGPPTPQESVYSPGNVSIGGRTTSVEVRALPSDEEDEELDAALSAAAADADKGGKQRFSIFRRRSPSPEKKGGSSHRSTDNQSTSSPFTNSNSNTNTATAQPYRQQPPVSPMGAFSPPRRSQELGPLALANANATAPAMSSPAISPGRAMPTSPHPYSDTAYSPAPPQYQPQSYPSQQYTDTVEDDLGVDTDADLWGGMYKNSTTATLINIPSNAHVMDYPYIDCGLEDANPPIAEFVLLATSGHLRVYSTESVRHADRITNRKTRFEPGAVFAGTFLSELGPGVVSLSSDGGISVHSVPNLTLLLSRPLAAPDALGFPWRAADEATSGAWTCSLEGQLLLTAPGNELARLGVIRDTVGPVGASSTFDWDLAKAARAAAASVVGSEKASRASSIDLPSPGGTTFLSQVKGAAAAATGAVLQEIEKMKGGILPPRELPTLRTLFEREVESLILDEDDIDYMREEDEEDDDGSGLETKESNKVAAAGAAAAVAAVAAAGKAKDKAKDLASAAFQGAATGGAKLKSMLPGRRGSGENDVDEALAKAAAQRDRRNELLGTASAPSATTASGRRSPPPPIYTSAASRASTSTSSGRQPPRRTTSEIKRVYGHSRAQDARVTMERNKAMLAERGQKLANLEERSAAMRGDAEDFASMAAELEAHFSNRKWWQF